MTNPDKKTPSEEPAKAAEPHARRPYRRPSLRALGSVREVTWGPGSPFEGGFVGKKLAKM